MNASMWNDGMAQPFVSNSLQIRSIPSPNSLTYLYALRNWAILTINIFVFVVAFALVVEKLHTLVKVEFLAFVAYTHETFVCLVGVKLNACRNTHKQDAVLPTFTIRTWQIFTPDPNRRITEVERNSKQLIQPFFVSINPFYSAGLVRNTNGKHTTIGISHCHNGYR